MICLRSQSRSATFTRRLSQMRRSRNFAEVDTAAHGCQHQVTFAHAAQEPVEFLKPLAAIGVRLVLVSGLNGLPQLVIVGTGIETAELRGAERDETVAKPFRDEVVAVDVGPAHHPRSLHGCRRFRSPQAATLPGLPDKKLDKRIKQALGWLPSGMERLVALLAGNGRGYEASLGGAVFSASRLCCLLVADREPAISCRRSRARCRGRRSACCWYPPRAQSGRRPGHCCPC